MQMETALGRCRYLSVWMETALGRCRYLSVWMENSVHCIACIINEVMIWLFLLGLLLSQDHTNTNTFRLNSFPSRRTWVSQFLVDFPHLHTSYLTPSHHVLLRQEKGRQWRKRCEEKVHSMRGNWCLSLWPDDVAVTTHQPVLKTSIGTHPFFSHQQTLEGRDFALFYVCS